MRNTSETAWLLEYDYRIFFTENNCMLFYMHGRCGTLLAMYFIHDGGCKAFLAMYFLSVVHKSGRIMSRDSRKSSTISFSGEVSWYHVPLLSTGSSRCSPIRTFVHCRSSSLNASSSHRNHSGRPSTAGWRMLNWCHGELYSARWSTKRSTTLGDVDHQSLSDSKWRSWRLERSNHLAPARAM